MTSSSEQQGLEGSIQAEEQQGGDGGEPRGLGPQKGESTHARSQSQYSRDSSQTWSLRLQGLKSEQYFNHLWGYSTQCVGDLQGPPCPKAKMKKILCMINCKDLPHGICGR